MNLTNLPDLVIIGILKIAMTDLSEIDSIKNALPYLAICQKWRVLAQPIMYRLVLIEGNNNPSQVLVSNLDLVSDGRYTKKLVIHVPNEETKLIDVLEPLLIQLNAGKAVTDWPTNDFKDHLFGGPFNNILHYSSQMMDAELAGVVSKCLQNFTTRFPNVTELYIKLSNSSSINGQFASQLISIYDHQLTELICDVNSPLQISHFPRGLLRLSYKYPHWGNSSMPIINSLPLKKLGLEYAPDGWSWQLYCESPVLPNLELLSISTSPYDELKPMSDLMKRVNLPNLKKLYIDESALNRDYWLKLGDISQHLERVIIDGSLSTLQEIRELPVKSIKWFSVNLRDFEGQNMPVFYRITNQMFSYYSNVLLELSGDLELDYRQTKWKNVKELTLFSANTNIMIEALTHVSNLETLAVEYLFYDDLDESLLKRLGNSKVKKLKIGTYYAGDGNEEIKIKDQLEMIRKHLPNISRA